MRDESGMTPRFFAQVMEKVKFPRIEMGKTTGEAGIGRKSGAEFEISIRHPKRNAE